MVIMQYSDNGSVYSPIFAEEKLYEIQMACASKPNPLYQLKRQVKLFGEASATPGAQPMVGQQCHNPRDMDEMGTMFHAVHQWVGRSPDDIDEVGWEKSQRHLHLWPR